ncbi:MAG: type II toxin-antitoxin system Phd/YefM family antitoxin [Verrucomicrobiae bacterium]|nr:type II toxin-antitoxin system Phd/YefM family antitoxin [Verrucomicrobiae bacterium]
MKSVNALAVRQSLGSILSDLEAGGEPVLVTRDRKPVAALVPIEIFRQRFVDFVAGDALRAAMEELMALQSASSGADSLETLRALREGSDDRR